MDVQGAELLVLEGFGELLKNVKAIIFEASFSENYVGGCTFDEIDLFLKSKGFNYLISDRFGKARPQQSLMKRLLRRRQAEFNCLYVNQGEGIEIA